MRSLFGTWGLRAMAVTALLATGACSSILFGGGPEPRIYSLTPSTEPFEGGMMGWQLLIEKPISTNLLNSPRIAVKDKDGSLTYINAAEWVDPLPSMVQGLLIESFENSGRILSVGRESSGLRADYVLLTEIRDFQAEFGPGKSTPTIRVRIHHKLVKMPRRTIEAGETFEATVPVAGSSLPEIISAFDTAFHDVAKRAAEWALRPGQRPAGSM